MSYVITSFGNTNLWNTRDEPTGVDLSTIRIKDTSTSTRLEATMLDSDGQWDVVLEGTFDLSNNPTTANNLLLGSTTRFESKLNGTLFQLITYETGFDIIQWLTSMAYRYSLLGGDDTFLASKSTSEYGDQIRGGSGNDHFTGYRDGIDATGKANYDSFFGEDGLDTAHYQGNLAAYTLETQASIWDGRTEVQSTGFSIRDSVNNRDGTDWLKEVERLAFSDTMVGLDVGAGGHTGQVYRLYLTVLGRNPETDPVGCGFWIDKLDRDVITTEQMVGYFLDSSEFVTRFGGTTNTNESFVNLMYLNLLGRDGHPDSGFNFWLNVLDTKAASREQVVASFMESPENVTNAAPLIGDAPTYQQWTG